MHHSGLHTPCQPQPRRGPELEFGEGFASSAKPTAIRMPNVLPRENPENFTVLVGDRGQEEQKTESPRIAGSTFQEIPGR